MDLLVEYDLLVVGAGTAGCLASIEAAKAGLNVCLIDMKPEGRVGDKVCGDGVGRHHFDGIRLAYPSGVELSCRMEEADIYSPDMKTVFRLRSEGFMVNRREFGQRLLRDALNQGVLFLDRMMALEPIIKGGYVRGVVAESLMEGVKRDIYAKVTIDSSGVSAVVRRSLPPELNLETKVNQEDMVLCYREIREVDEELGFNCQIYLNQDIAPGGYFWIFPKGGRMVNVGIGVQMKKGCLNPKIQLYNHVLSKPLFKGSKIIHGGGGIAPTRRPLDCLASNGFMVAGDAACLANPIHAGGIGPSMLSGKLAAEAAVEALEGGDVSKEALWRYNVKYMKAYGAKQAGLHIFRLFLQSCVNEDLNYGMKHSLIKEEDVLKASLEGELSLSIPEKVVRVFRSLGRLRLINRLRVTSKIMREARELHIKYPEPKDFEVWRKQIKQVYFKASKLIQ